MARILIFGDSIAWGAWDIKGGWANRLRSELDKSELGRPDKHIQAYNLGISGDTSGGVLERLENEIKARIPASKEISIIISIGANDTQYIKSENRVRTSPEKFRENIERLIEISGKYSQEILFLGLTPVQEEKTIPIPWSPDKSYNNERIREYNKILEEICGKKEIPFLELISLFEKRGKESLLFDGLHPNSKGHELIFQEVIKSLEKNKLI
jgi:lysophospholipase L1-like esterase